MLLPAVTADGLPAAEAVAAMGALCPSGSTLLHLAVGTGSVPLVAALAAWGRAAEHAWQVDAQGGAAHGLTPLHLAALLPNGTQMRAALAAMSPAANKLWGVVQADDGTTPEALADALVAAAAAAPAAAAASPAEPDASLASTCSSGVLADLAKAVASGSKASARPAGAGGAPHLGGEAGEGGLSSASSSAELQQVQGERRRQAAAPPPASRAEGACGWRACVAGRTATHRNAVHAAPSPAEPSGSNTAHRVLTARSSLPALRAAGGKGGGGGKALGEGGFCGAGQRRSGRAAIKQHLDDLHMT